MYNNSEQFFRVLKKHYILHLNQNEIAQSEQLSTATVSRMISRAMKLGYVKYKLDLPVQTVFDLEQKIKERFGLEYVSVTSVSLDNDKIIPGEVSKAVANYLNSIVMDGDIIGVSWGRTISKVVQKLEFKSMNGVRVVGLNGGISSSKLNTGSDTIVSALAKNYNGVGYILPVPSFVDNSVIANSLRSDSKIKEIFTLINKSNIVLFGIGGISYDSILIESGYFSINDYQKLREEGYVGDICSRYFKIDGSHPNDELYNRVMGISLEKIKEKKHSICVVMDDKKAESLLGAIRGGYVKSLFIDEKTANKLLDID